MKLDKLEIIAGTVVEVQIIERQLETAPALGGGDGAKAGTATIIGRQRIFIDGPGVADPHYDFDRCELAVRREQEVAFARLPGKGKGKPVNVMLVNRTMGTHWPFLEAIDGLAAGPQVGVTAMAAGWAIAAGVLAFVLLAFLIMPGAMMQAVLLAIVAALAAFLVLWVVFAALRLGGRERRRAAAVAAVLDRLKAAPVKVAQ
jgi:hypothetical protein